MTIVSLTFDDGLESQLDNAMPVLDRFGVAGTFYTNVGADRFVRRSDDWRRASERGHELGNHSVFHPGVRSKSWVTEGIALENYSLDRMACELAVANNVLEMLDGRCERSFAFPCSNPVLGNPGIVQRTMNRLGHGNIRPIRWLRERDLDIGSTQIDYTPVVRKLFPVARCGSVALDELVARPVDRHRVGGVQGDGMNAAQLCAVVDRAIENDAWLVLVFHAIGEDHALSCTPADFTELVRRLAGEGDVRLLPFLEAARVVWPEPSPGSHL